MSRPLGRFQSQLFHEDFTEWNRAWTRTRLRKTNVFNYGHSSAKPGIANCLCIITVSWMKILMWNSNVITDVMVFSNTKPGWWSKETCRWETRRRWVVVSVPKHYQPCGNIPVTVEDISQMFDITTEGWTLFIICFEIILTCFFIDRLLFLLTFVQHTDLLLSWS